VGLVVVGLVAESGEEADDGDVFIERFPVEAAAVEADLLASFRGGVQQAREPCQRYSQDATVAQVYPEAVFVEANSGWAN